MKKKKQNKTTEVIVADEPTYTEEDIKLFLEECGKKPSFKQADLREALAKEPSELVYKDIRVLFDKAGQLSDEERFKFRNILVYESMTSDEKVRYTRVYPSSHKFDKYFPKKDDVEKQYENHFLDN